MVSVSAFLEFSLSAVHELDVHFFKPPPEDGKRIISEQKQLFQAPTPQGTRSGERWEKRFAASENHSFSNPLPPQGTSSQGRWKNDFRQAKITVSSLLPPQGTSSAKRWKKTIVGKRKSLFQSLPLPRHQLWRREKTIFGKQKSPFQSPYAPQGTSSGGRWKKQDAAHEPECSHVEHFCETSNWTVLYMFPLLPYQCTADCGMR